MILQAPVAVMAYATLMVTASAIMDGRDRRVRHVNMTYFLKKVKNDARSELRRKHVTTTVNQTRDTI